MDIIFQTSIWIMAFYFSLSVSISIVKLLTTWLKCKKEELGWD